MTTAFNDLPLGEDAERGCHSECSEETQEKNRKQNKKSWN